MTCTLCLYSFLFYFQPWPPVWNFILKDSFVWMSLQLHIAWLLESSSDFTKDPYSHPPLHWTSPFSISMDVLRWAPHAFQWVPIDSFGAFLFSGLWDTLFPLAFSCTDPATTQLLWLWVFIFTHLCFLVHGETLPFAWLVNVIREFLVLPSSFCLYVGIWRIKLINLG